VEHVGTDNCARERGGGHGKKRDEDNVPYLHTGEDLEENATRSGKNSNLIGQTPA